MRDMDQQETEKFNEVVNQVSAKLSIDVTEVQVTLNQMGCLYADEEEVNGFVWVVESSDCLLDSDVVETFEEALTEVCDEMSIEFVC